MSVVLRENQYRKIIENLINLRKKNGWKQEDVARLLKTNQSRISRIESCQTQLDVLQLKAFAKLYKVDLESLY